MQHDIPIKVFTEVLCDTELISKDNATLLKGCIEDDDLQGFFFYLDLFGFNLDNQDMGKTCKGVVLTLDIPDKLPSTKKTNQFKSIW